MRIVIDRHAPFVALVRSQRNRRQVDRERHVQRRASFDPSWASYLKAGPNHEGFWLRILMLDEHDGIPIGVHDLELQLVLLVRPIPRYLEQHGQPHGRWLWSDDVPAAAQNEQLAVSDLGGIAQ